MMFVDGIRLDAGQNPVCVRWNIHNGLCVCQNGFYHTQNLLCLTDRTQEYP